MDELKYTQFLDQIDRLGEQVELDEPAGLTIDALDLAAFYVEVEIEEGAA